MRNFLYSFLIISMIGASAFVSSSVVKAQTVEELQQKITAQTLAIKKLEDEIAQFQGDIATLAAKKKTLSNAIASLDVTRKKLAADIKLTETKVNTSDLKIRQLNDEIAYRESEIDARKVALREAVLSIYESDEQSISQVFLSNQSFSDIWNDFETLEQFSASVGENIKLINSLKIELEQKNTAEKAEKENLLDLKDELGDRKKIADDNKKETSQLLAQTKNKESEYQKLLAEKQAAKEQFEKELYELESQLKFILDPNSIPAKGSGVLAWPLSSVKITQYFGNTEFAQSGAYNGKGHNGVDFRAAVGTKVYAALSGKVKAVNIKVAYMCQYGKWVLVEHDNGLTTLYAHLSLVNVDPGDTIQTGQLIGYSGETGYSIGPHLHFTVYASKAVNLKEYTCNSGVKQTIPVSAFSGYLNPMDYL